MNNKNKSIIVLSVLVILIIALVVVLIKALCDGRETCAIVSSTLIGGLMTAAGVAATIMNNYYQDQKSKIEQAKPYLQMATVKPETLDEMKQHHEVFVLSEAKSLWDVNNSGNKIVQGDQRLEVRNVSSGLLRITEINGETASRLLQKGRVLVIICKERKDMVIKGEDLYGNVYSYKIHRDEIGFFVIDFPIIDDKSNNKSNAPS